MAEPYRPIHPLFMVGLIGLPAVFVWFLLLPGFAPSTRWAAFTYAFCPSLVLLIGSLLALALQAAL